MIEKYIKPEELPTRLVEWKDPQPNDNEILIDVHYAGLNCEPHTLTLHLCIQC